jgi:O-antigen ligase
MPENTGILRKFINAGILAIVVVAPTQYGVEIAKKTYLSPVDPLVWLVCGIWLFEVLKTRRGSSICWPPLFSILFILVAILSWLKASPSLKSFKEIFQLSEYFVAGYLLLASSLVDSRLFKWTVYAFLGVTTVILALGLVQYLSPCTEAFKVRATFGNRNVFGGYLALTLPLFFGLMLLDSNWPRRIWYLLTLVAGIAVTLSGGTLIALLSAMGLMAAFKSQKALALLAAVGLVVSMFLLPHLPRDNGGILYESIRLYDDNTEVSRRYTEWEAALGMMRENLWTGVGIGRYQENIGTYYGTLPHPPGTTSEHDSQNLYLVIGSSTGVVGLLAFLGMLFLFATRAGKLYYQLEDPWLKGLSLGLLGGLLAFSINSIWSPLLVRGLGIPLVLIWSLLTALEKREARQ